MHRHRMSTASPTPARRPLKSRGRASVRRLAAALAARRVSPNLISIASVVLAAAGGAALAAAPEAPALLLAAAVTIQLRLLCNLLDGLVAVEGGLRTPDGELYNEVPDRVADTLLLVGAGYGAGVPELGWAAALAAALTAYVRAFGGALGQAQDFSGVMSKPRRMALLTLASLVALIDLDALIVGLALITAGSLLTCVTRLRGVRRRLRA